MKPGIIVAAITVLVLCATIPVSAVEAPFDSVGAPQAADTTITISGTDSLSGVIEVVPPQGRPGRAEDRFEMSRTLELMGNSEIEADTAWERRKNPKLAMLLSALMPGMGQLYNGRRIKVGVAAGTFMYYAGNAILSQKKATRFEVRRNGFEIGSNEWNFYNGLHSFWKDDARTFAWWTGAAWLFILIDSWIDAHLYDIRAYTPPTGEASISGDKTEYMTVNFKF